MRAEVLDAKTDNSQEELVSSQNVVLGYENLAPEYEGWGKPINGRNFLLMNATSLGEYLTDCRLREEEVFPIIASHEQTMIMSAFSTQNDVGVVTAHLYDRVSEEGFDSRDLPISRVEKTDLIRNPEKIRVGDELNLAGLEVLAETGYTVILKHKPRNN